MLISYLQGFAVGRIEPYPCAHQRTKEWRISSIDITYITNVADNMLADLDWSNYFLLETPGDDEVGGLPRQVPGACWSRVPYNCSKPLLRLWSMKLENF